MAIYHCHIQRISRSDGRSSVAAAAYRTGTLLFDPRTGKFHDFQKRTGVIDVGRVGWHGTENLWVCAELADNRKNSCTCREVMVAVPCELSPDQAVVLLETYASKLHDAHGIAIEWALHGPAKGSDARNLHGHIMTTTRRSDGMTLGEKARELDDRTTGPEHVTGWRCMWEDCANSALAEAGRSERIDGRSHASKGDGLQPVPRLPRSALQMERKGIATTLGARQRTVIEENRRKLQEDLDRQTAKAKAMGRLSRVPAAVLAQPIPIIGISGAKLAKQAARIVANHERRIGGDAR